MRLLCAFCASIMHHGLGRGLDALRCRDSAKLVAGFHKRGIKSIFTECLQMHHPLFDALYQLKKEVSKTFPFDSYGRKVLDFSPKLIGYSLSK